MSSATNPSSSLSPPPYDATSYDAAFAAGRAAGREELLRETNDLLFKVVMRPQPPSTQPPVVITKKKRGCRIC
jgi:hypothetical protein